MSDSDFAALQEKHAGKRLARVDLTSVGTLVFRSPSRAEYRQFKSQILEPTTAGAAYDSLAFATCVSPDGGAFLAMLESRPGLTSNKKVIVALNRLSGSEDEEEGKD